MIDVSKLLHEIVTRRQVRTKIIKQHDAYQQLSLNSAASGGKTSDLVISFVRNDVMVFLDGKKYRCGGKLSSYFQDVVTRLHNIPRINNKLSPLNYSCDLEKLADEAVVGCPSTPREISKDYYANFDQYQFALHLTVEER
ncbi:hypothetical protein KIN20_035945 [Parelaphostrongylus tenuis]|uniref:Uncharacterized protein n=1 Tax=Parelaphostrongylus tenuis TaxID=148309 RepID=A0AAD5RFE0_PARTN|nr:hypothetical protein KIN20_035945 [Parelaphostrongylus tenuis]